MFDYFAIPTLGGGIYAPPPMLNRVKICKKEGTKMHKHRPVQPVWRELLVRRKHLTPNYKVKVMGRVAKLFSGRLMSLGNWDQADVTTFVGFISFLPTMKLTRVSIQLVSAM